MSAVLETPIDFRDVRADIIETSTGRRIKRASAVRWVWQPFKDIKLFDNLSPAYMNNLTLQDTPVMVLRRCQPYPVTNCEFNVARHEARRYGFVGDFLPENDLPDNYSGASPTNPAPAQVVETKYAYSAAQELSERYSKEYGFTVLEPLTGQEDSNIIRQVFEMVQPRALKLITLERDLKEGAKERIRKSTHPKEVKALAEGCRVLMLKGCGRATEFAKAHHADFSMQIQKASAGHKGNRAAPVDYDEEIADHLGVEVPRVVQVVKVKNTSEELLNRLAEKEIGRDEGQEDLRALLEEERAARLELEQKVESLLKGKAA